MRNGGSGVAEGQRERYMQSVEDVCGEILLTAAALYEEATALQADSPSPTVVVLAGVHWEVGEAVQLLVAGIKYYALGEGIDG
jgi:hypothetical protein